MGGKLNVSLEVLALGAGILKVSSEGGDVYRFVPYKGKTHDIPQVQAEAHKTEVVPLLAGIINTEFEDLEAAERYVKACLALNHLLILAAHSSLSEMSEETLTQKAQHYEETRRVMNDNGSVALLESNRAFVESEFARLMHLPFEEAVSYVKTMRSIG